MPQQSVEAWKRRQGLHSEAIGGYPGVQPSLSLFPHSSADHTACNAPVFHGQIAFRSADRARPWRYWSPRDPNYAVPFAASSTRGLLCSAVARVPCITVVVRPTNHNHKAAALFTRSWWIRREGRRRISPALHDAIDVDHASAAGLLL
ncbi:hypothetical protein BJ912DRAFT_1147997 [Pholiota molesta]|nr:hypothetical protein BJ912DRAFT_1147997 [Pholiota molesta]